MGHLTFRTSQDSVFQHPCSQRLSTSITAKKIGVFGEIGPGARPRLRHPSDPQHFGRHKGQENPSYGLENP